LDIQNEIKSTVELHISKKILLNVLFCQNEVVEKCNEVLKPFDLSSEQYNVLRILRGQRGNPANMGCIQERMICKTSNTTRLVDKLLLKNLVTREICPSNRRKIEVNITQKGLDVLAALDPAITVYENQFVQNMTAVELANLNELLEKYRTKK
jgi:DNA-binding MarR family transcriptional regulator